MIASLKNRAIPFTATTINYFNLDCNALIDPLLLKLPSFSLDFCFIDPTNWQIKFDSVRRLTKDRRMDLAITFHIGEMKRVAEDAPKELDDFFGGPSWQENYREMLSKGKREGGRILLDFYKQKLIDIGYQDFDDHVRVKTRTGVPLYHLLFASKDKRGKDFWSKISQKSSTGQLRLPLQESKG